MTGADIRHIRRLADITQEELARRASVPLDFFKKVEGGYISRHNQDRISRIQKQIIEISQSINCPHPYIKRLGFQQGVGMLYNCTFCGSTITK
jgi:predicted transcriptional regulator